ncbi:MAG: hypothetical protein AAGF57_06180 [Pseudomonadota bacterium]
MFNNTPFRNTVLAIALTSWSASNLANAVPDEQSSKRSGPPPEALAACDGSAAGDSCSFTSPRGDSIEGSCIVPRSDKGLACKPEGGPPRDIQASSGSSDGE